MTPPLWALSIQQPWLDLIVRGEKTMEIREWESKHRGPMVLHASRTIDFPAAYLFGYRHPWKLPRGCLVAVVDVIDVVTIESRAHASLLAQHRQAVPPRKGVYGFVLCNVRPLRRAIAVRGEPGVFPLRDHVAEQVREQVSFPVPVAHRRGP